MEIKTRAQIWSEMEKAGATREAIELLCKATAPLRHEARVQATMGAALTRAARTGLEGEEARRFAGWLCALDVEGIGGPGGWGGWGSSTGRMAWAGGLGKGRWQASDGGVYRGAALVAFERLTGVSVFRGRGEGALAWGGLTEALRVPVVWVGFLEPGEKAWAEVARKRGMIWLGCQMVGMASPNLGSGGWLWEPQGTLGEWEEAGVQDQTPQGERGIWHVGCSWGRSVLQPEGEGPGKFFVEWEGRWFEFRPGDMVSGQWICDERGFPRGEAKGRTYWHDEVNDVEWKDNELVFGYKLAREKMPEDVPEGLLDWLMRGPPPAVQGTFEVVTIRRAE